MLEYGIVYVDYRDINLRYDPAPTLDKQIQTLSRHM